MTHIERSTVAVVPVRSLEGAKSRLGQALDAEERTALVVRLLRRTVAAARATEGIDRVLVVSPDPAVLAEADSAGALPVPQTSMGLNQALDEARATLAADVRLLILPGDIPDISPAALTDLVRAADEAGRPAVVLVPDRHGRGTNALLLDPAGVIPFAFGGDSREAHAGLAAAAGAAYVEVDSPLALDLDTPDDLLLAETLAPEALGVG